MSEGTLGASSARNTWPTSSCCPSTGGNCCQARSSFRSRQTRAMGRRAGQEGGKHPRRPLAGMVRRWAGCAPRLARRRMFGLSATAWAKASMQRWQRSALRAGRSRQHRSPVVGATAPSTEPPAKTCGPAPTGRTPRAVRRRRRTVGTPTRLSSWLHTRPGRVCTGGTARGHGSPQVAWDAPLASGCCGVPGPRHLARGRELGTDEGRARVGVDLQGRGLLAPLPQGFSGGEASRWPGRLRQSGPSLGGARQGLAWRHVQVQQGVQAPPGVAGAPGADGRARAPEPLGYVPAGRGLSAGQAGEHLAPWFLPAVMVTWYALLEGLCLFAQDRSGVAQSLLS
jgi:hypothetical protein